MRNWALTDTRLNTKSKTDRAPGLGLDKCTGLNFIGYKEEAKALSFDPVSESKQQMINWA